MRGDLPDLCLSVHPCSGAVFARWDHRGTEARRWPGEVPRP